MKKVEKKCIVLFVYYNKSRTMSAMENINSGEQIRNTIKDFENEIKTIMEDTQDDRELYTKLRRKYLDIISFMSSFETILQSSVIPKLSELIKESEEKEDDDHRTIIQSPLDDEYDELSDCENVEDDIVVKESVDSFVTILTNILKRDNIYYFTDTIIDNLRVCIRIVYTNTDKKRFFVRFYNNYVVDSNYSDFELFSRLFKSVRECVLCIVNVKNKYKLIGNKLCSPNKVEELRLQRILLPYEEYEKCSVCFENTMELTTCQHYLCFRCRVKILEKDKECCPICREDTLKYYYR